MSTSQSPSPAESSRRDHAAQPLLPQRQGDDFTHLPRPSADSLTRLTCLLLNVLQEDFPCHLGREATFFNAERRNTWPLFKASLSPNSLQVQAVGLDSLTKLDEVQILIQIRKNTTEGDKFYQVEVITHCLERDAKADGGERVIKSQEKSLNILFGIGWMVKGESRFAGDFDEMRFSHVLTLLKRASHSRWNMYGERRSEEEERQVIGELGGLFAIVRSTWGTLETAIQNADWNMNFEG